MSTKKLTAFALALTVGISTATIYGCKDDTPEEERPPITAVETMPEFKFETYDNADFSDYSEDGTVESERLPAQWEEYGAGDPYIFRYDGMYYLYVSTRDEMIGIRAWKSRDLLNWTPCRGEGLEEGYVCNESITKTAYAPEVIYFNGKFYMYTSPSGGGHYILTADSPEGPFRTVKQNFGMSIDGSVFIDDDEKMYFMNASGEGIEIRPMSTPDSVPGQATVLKNTKMGWTEGPMIIKRDGIYYLTYTGVHVVSPGYKIAYATERDGNPLTSADAFTPAAENPILQSTEKGFNGLGHSSTLLGPDMDSYYIVYHSLNALTGHGPWRSMNIDRLIFNGTQMSVDGSDKGSVAATLPEFYSDGTDGDNFRDERGARISTAASGKVFTAEFNYTGDKVKCIVGYNGAADYSYVVADYQAKSVTLYDVDGGKVKEVAAGELIKDYDADALHTVRVAYADGKADVYFDNMCKIRDAEVNISAGGIGHEGGDMSYIAFSNVAKGSSDGRELKQSGADIGSSAYLPEGGYENLTSHKFTGGTSLSEFSAFGADDRAYDGAKELKLAEEGDFARYSLYFREGGTFALSMTYDTKYAGKKLGLQVNLGNVKTITLPEAETADGVLVSATFAYIDVERGANLVTFHALKSDVGFISFTARPVTQCDMSETLTERVERAEYPTEYDIGGDGHGSAANRRSIVYFGGDMDDAEISVDIKLNSMNGKSAGLILRARNFADTAHDNENSLQGYYVGINSNSLFVKRCNYNFTPPALQSAYHGLGTGKWFNLKAVIQGNLITVYIDDMELYSFAVPHAIPTGRFGLYSDGAQATYKNLRLKSLA